MIYPLGMFGPWEVVIIGLVIVLLFGGKKIPELMHGLGKGVRSFKDGIKDVENEFTEISDEIDETPKKNSKASKTEDK